MKLETHIKDRMIACLAETPVETAYLFGSYATGEASEESDVDLLVKLPGEVNLLQMAKIKHRLEQETGRKVDLLTDEAIAPDIKPFVDQQRILIYERKR